MSMVETDIVLQAIEGLGGGIDTLTSKLDAAQDDLDTLKAKGVVKSIQHGASGYNNYNYSGVSIPISAVDASKAVPIVQCDADSDACFSEYFLESNTSLRVQSGGTSGSPRWVDFCWQVIEFY